jgi:hypothetical protein
LSKYVRDRIVSAFEAMRKLPADQMPRKLSREESRELRETAGGATLNGSLRRSMIARPPLKVLAAPLIQAAEKSGHFAEVRHSHEEAGVEVEFSRRPFDAEAKELIAESCAVVDRLGISKKDDRHEV